MLLTLAWHFVPVGRVCASYGGDAGYLKTQQAMQRLIPGSRLEVFDNAGHALFVDQADRFNVTVDEFVKATAPEREQ